MADALCGPSNALQNLQKHSTVDRTLQQDRLVGRHSPAQGFRSSPGPNAGALDSEFDAFQAGRPLGPPPALQPYAPRFAQPPPPQQHQFAPAPDWAADFQRLSVSSPPPQAFQQQPANAASAWHQDFLSQQTPASHAPALQQNTFGRMSGYNMGGFGAQSYLQTPSFQHTQVSETAQGKQRAQDAIPVFDEAAFERAFAQAQQDMMDITETEHQQQEPESAHKGQQALDLDRPGEMDPLLQRMRETRPAVYSAIQVWSETGLGRTDEAVSYLENMDRLEKSGALVQDANEGKWIVDSLQRIVDRDAPLQVKTRAEELIKAINQRLMSQYPLGTTVPMSEEQIWRDLDEAGYMRTPVREIVEQHEVQEQEQEQPPKNEDDEMATTAGRLLERVADNTSEKFQNSQFFGLMRRLRDREVRVQQDKIVQVDAPSSSTTQAQAQSQQQQPAQPQPVQPQQHPPPSTQHPPIDPHILSYASTDFSPPIYSPDDHAHDNSLSV
ncbi:hypothetical protein BDW02DRAFT_565863 [Decorospora gaudefroyi]|uniref:Peroxin 20 n=1 Tax=Decorospora gaudefroyi TaxID=184978 RepID=A0A6A5KPH5_9PLEO|nr:hypothetical protein BDW02DRAFT_565863 [Decorospora gaudefroyi]